MSMPDPNRHMPGEVDEYLSAQSDPFCATLEQLREIIRRIAPA